jgi:hypothetical protein
MNEIPVMFTFPCAPNTLVLTNKLRKYFSPYLQNVSVRSTVLLQCYYVCSNTHKMLDIYKT